MDECKALILEENILQSIKHLLGIQNEVDVFDKDIALHINTVFSHLYQIGVIQEPGFMLTSGKEKWMDFFLATESNGGNDVDIKKIQNVKTFVYIKVKLIFDPPTNASILKAFESQAKEIEYRLYTQKGGY